MIKTLQRKFITIAMLSLFAILLVVVGAINVFYVYNNSKSTEKIMNVLMENDGKFVDYGKPPKEAKTDIKPRMNDGFSKETPFETRYFWIKSNSNGEIFELNTGHIAALTASDVEDYAKTVFKIGKTDGYISSYKYKLESRDYGTFLLFIDRRMQINSQLTLLLITVGVSICAVVLMFLLLSLLSKRVLSPIIESYEKQKTFITDAGHEIKTPLAIISANADVLELESGKSEWTASIKNQVKRLDKLVKSLLTLSKLDEEETPLAFTAVAISDLAKDMIAAFDPLMVTKKLSLCMNIEENIFINGNLEAIEKLFSILLDNAVKYADDGGEITVCLVKSGGNMRIDLSNTSKNIPSGDLNRLFDRFYRSDTSRNQKNGGYGIGLSVARSVVMAHKGKIIAKLENSDTIRFTVILPL